MPSAPCARRIAPSGYGDKRSSLSPKLWSESAPQWRKMIEIGLRQTVTSTAYRLLRHAVYVSLREDKLADQVRREAARG